MSAAEDAELTQELEALVAAKEQEQRRMRGWFAASLGAFVLSCLAYPHPARAVGFLLLSITALVFAIAAFVFGIRAHLRAAALRGQALEKILAEAFRRAGKESPEVEP